jgi:hypothetical protein
VGALGNIWFGKPAKKKAENWKNKPWTKNNPQRIRAKLFHEFKLNLKLLILNGNTILAS